IAVKARAFDAKDVVTEPNPGSNPTDDRAVAVLEDHADDPVLIELTSFIGALSEDERVDLVTLAWVGRGDGTLDDWSELREEAARMHTRRTARYLLGMPLIADFLEEGLAQFGRTCRD